MGYDGAPSPASAAARDAKKKRGNRSSAKLKQCKLDARREQWLSQVKDGKEATAKPLPAAAGSGAGSNAGSPILASPHPPLPRRRADARSRGGALEDDKEDAGATGHEVGGSDLDSPMHSPCSDNSRGGGCAQSKRCSSNGGGPSLSSVSSLWSSSRSVSDAEDDDTGSGPEEENGVLDDWEAVADALSVDDNSHCHQSFGTTIPPTATSDSVPQANTSKRTEPIRSNARAWAPDDTFRPQSLPSISKQASFPARIGNCWGMGMSAAHQSILSMPLSCPICYEDLDPTDSSFLPCPCGFHLCLFCHKRILEADARCPGCRKLYNAGSAAEGGAPAPVRLSRSCSMGPRH
ncbi:General negative regulator of transcription subunit 4 [Hordeum vulgare]|uniref:RING-type domain-containing protein n=1 Tax=Hordeum vulgare subsp. vulgare TaxID=112509 RepID=A0A8I6WVE9_HORVV|nr:uncharacterized protein LOC123426935 [Hordeum vulgare subsp. vulgare]KAE8808827.1 General negative regulator of transcription subunit 4 [Hordeum vulgare]KAI5014801.1 hypothetical protein ZWY2020_056191 [Hordeum vulgare]